MSRPFALQARQLAPLIVPLVTIALMTRDAAREAGPTGLPGDLPNWHTRGGDLTRFATMVAVETLIIYLVLRPWSYRRNWGRPILAMVLAVPWTLLHGLMMIHSGGIMVIHFFWLLFVCFSLVVLTIYSALNASMQRHTASSAVAPQ